VGLVSVNDGMTSDNSIRSCLPDDDVAIVIPVFNDWEPVVRLLAEIDSSLGAAKLTGRVVVVDDGSDILESGQLGKRKFANLHGIEIIHLISNHGHQRAIAVGIVHLVRSGIGAKAVVVMDGDGEDRPDHIPRLLEELYRTNRSVMFARRTQRCEGPLFRLMYNVYRFVYWLLLGISVRWGNYSVVRASALPVLATSPDLWNHYAACVVRSRLRFGSIGLPRGIRYAGQSHMNYTSLVIHGLSSIAASSEVLGARLLMTLSGLLAFFSVAIVAEWIARLWTPFVIPNIAIAVSVTLAGLTVQGIAFTVLFTLIVLSRRTQTKIIPLRDAQAYVASVERIVPAGR